MSAQELSLTQLVVIAALAFALGGILVYVANKLAIRLGVVDMPNIRKIHRTPTARLGGLGTVPSVVVATVVGYHLLGLGDDSRLIAIVLTSSLVFVVGLMDDFCRLNPWVKFWIEVLAAGSLIVWVYSPAISFQNILLVIPAILWLVGAANALNLSDGLDGLASGIAVITSIALGIISYHKGFLLGVLLSPAIVGASLAFLLYNAHPSSIFMGDSGALTLGYLAGVGLLFAVAEGVSWNTPSLSRLSLAALVPMFSMGIPVIDTLWAIWRRIADRRPAFSPDMNHVHHRLIRTGMTYDSVVWTEYILSCAGGLIGVYLSGASVTHYLVYLMPALIALATVTTSRRWWMSRHEILVGYTQAASARDTADGPGDSA